MKYPEVSKRLTFAMNERGIKAVELSERSGVSKASISQYTNGTHCPSNKMALQLAQVLRVNPLWLMDLDDDMNRELSNSAKNDAKLRTVVEYYKTLSPENQALIDNMLAALTAKQN